jgi:hypothetical protein
MTLRDVKTVARPPHGVVAQDAFLRRPEYSARDACSVDTLEMRRLWVSVVYRVEELRCALGEIHENSNWRRLVQHLGCRVPAKSATNPLRLEPEHEYTKLSLP